MAKRLVSVITPTFNRSHSLKKAVQSVLAQEHSDFEQLIINDGGEDVAEVVNSFSDSRLRYFNRPHGGKAAALNFALSQARGQYISYLDDDDLIYPQHLSLLVEALEANKDASAAYSDTYVVYQRFIDNCWQEVYREVENDLDVDYSMLYWQNYINHKNIIHTRHIIAAVGNYDESLPVLIDWDYIRRLAYKTRLVHVRKITAEYNRRVGDHESKTAIYFEKPQLFNSSEKRILAKLPRPDSPRKKNPPLKVVLEQTEAPPALKEKPRILLFRSAPMVIFSEALMKVRKLYPDAIIDVLGQPAVSSELESIPGINQVLLNDSGHFHPAHVKNNLLQRITSVDYQMGVIVLSDNEGIGYKNVVGFAKVLTLPKLFAINREMTLFTL